MIKHSIWAVAITFLLVVLACRSTDNLGERTTVRIQGKTFASTPFVSGVPNVLGIKLPPLDDPIYALVQLPDTVGVIYVVYGVLGGGQPFASCLLDRVSRGGAVVPIPVSSDKSVVSAIVSLRFDNNSNAKYPIAFQIDLAQRKLAYRWVHAEQDSSPPGGMPALAPPSNDPIVTGNMLPLLPIKSLFGDEKVARQSSKLPVVINWWATWCMPCIQEIPGFNSLVDKYAGSVVFKAIANNTPDEAIAFLEKHEFRFVHFVVVDSAAAMLGEELPRTIVVNANGVVVFDKRGGSPSTYLEVDQVLGQITAQQSP